MSKIILLIMSVALSTGIVAHADGYHHGEDPYNYDTPRIPDDNYGRADRGPRYDRDVDPGYYGDFEEEDYSSRRRHDHDHDHDHHDPDCNRCRPVCDAWTCGAPPVLPTRPVGLCTIVENGYGWSIVRNGYVIANIPYSPWGIPPNLRWDYIRAGQCSNFTN